MPLPRLNRLLMTSLFLLCAAIGALVLVLQIILGLLGLDHTPHGVETGLHVSQTGLGEGLELLSVRALSAGVSFYGIGGLMALSLGMSDGMALVAALVPGLAALLATAFIVRQVMRLESDGSLQIERAIGEPATVYLTIPGRQSGPGKVQLALQGRTVEFRAVTPEEKPIPTGAPVVVVSIVDTQTVEVIPTSILGEILDDNR